MGKKVMTMQKTLEQDIDLGSAWAMIGLLRTLKLQGKLNTPEGDAEIEAFGNKLALFNGQREKEAAEREAKRKARLEAREARRNAPLRVQSNLPKRMREKLLREWYKARVKDTQGSLFA